MGATVLSPSTASLILFVVFFGLLFLRVPVAFALGLACLPILLIEPRLSAMSLMSETFNSYNSFILLAVPFFLLTANLMNVGGITERLVKLSRTMVGHFPGGLAQINVVLSLFFAGISGSSTADAASQSKIFIEAQRREGYHDSFSVAITAVSSVLAVIIPPSILMIIWGGVLSVSIGALFLAGILPGLLLVAVQMVALAVFCLLAFRGIASGTVPTAISFEWNWLNPFSVKTVAALVSGLSLSIFIYWGWDTAVSINEETSDPETTPGRAKLAFLHLGSVKLELIEPVDGPSTWRDFLEQHGQGIHHIAFLIQGMQGVLAQLDAQGIALVQKGEYKGGRYAYVDGTNQLAAILELLEND